MLSSTPSVLLSLDMVYFLPCTKKSVVIYSASGKIKFRKNIIRLFECKYKVMFSNLFCQ